MWLRKPIGHGRSNWRDAWLAHTAGLVLPRDDVHLYVWHLRKGEDRIVFRARLHHATKFDCDFAFERCRKTKCDGSFHLGANEIGVHCDAAIYHAYDTMDADRAS